MRRTLNGLAVVVISCLFLIQISFAKPTEPEKTVKTNKLADKSPAELIELWDSASHAEQVIIQDRLIDNIPSAIPALRNKVSDGTEKQKLFGCAMLAEFGDTNSVPILMKAMDDPDDKVRTRAISCLRKLKANQAAEKIRQQIPNARNNGVLKVSLVALGELGDKHDINILRTYLSDQDESVRVDAAAAMALLGNYDGQGILIAGTESFSPGVKKEATYSLGFIGTTEAKNRLQEIIDDPNGQWKSYAQIAVIQQELLNKLSVQQMPILEATANNQNQRVAEWAVEKLSEFDNADSILREIGKNKTPAGRKAMRILKVKGGR